MLAGLLLHGALLVGFLLVYARWLDDAVIGDVCLVGLATELAGVLSLGHYAQAVDCVFFCQLGGIETALPLLTCSLVLGFDELSGYFFSLLALALLVCFIFLAEYFEYDANAGAVTQLSALFSQAALLYFCAFDLLLLLALWELISLISFFLVQHWAARLVTYKAGLKVFTVSQLGDLPFFAFIFGALATFQTSDLTEFLPAVSAQALEYVSIASSHTALLHVNTALALCLSSAIFLKAAQWFFYPWLLDAMEAPVPISAQLHSSTLVVIGFYLFFRFQALYDQAPLLNGVLLVAGGSSALGASVLAAYQTDGKRLLACSTAGQLGYVVVCLGLGLRGEALALLLFCCANKALTFVWFGVLMRRHGGLSDFRALGGLPALPWLAHAGLACALAAFTACPGALVWHVKCLVQPGQPAQATLLARLGLELLQLTWACSSLYLAYLYAALFLAKRANGSASQGFRAGPRNQTSAARHAYAGTPPMLAGVLWGGCLALGWHASPWAALLVEGGWGLPPLPAYFTYY